LIGSSFAQDRANDGNTGKEISRKMTHYVRNYCPTIAQRTVRSTERIKVMQRIPAILITPVKCIVVG